MQTTNSISRRLARAARGAAILALASVAATACSDPFTMKAQYATEPFSFSLYALSGAGPANAPAALDLLSRAPMRVDGNFTFDVAFDLDGKGKIVIIPQKLVGTALSGARIVALQRISGTYESVLLAPVGGWQADSALSVLPGEVVGVRMTSTACSYQLSNLMYAKFTIDSVRAGGFMFGHGVVNPNCGFKSFESGVPTK